MGKHIQYPGSIQLITRFSQNCSIARQSGRVATDVDNPSGGKLLRLNPLFYGCYHFFCTIAGRIEQNCSNFMFFAAGSLTVAWVLPCLYYLSLFYPLPVAAQLVLTVALYPPLTWLFSRTETRLLRSN